MYDPDHLYDQDRRYEPPPPPLVPIGPGLRLLGIVACSLLVIVLAFVIWI